MGPSCNSGGMGAGGPGGGPPGGGAGSDCCSRPLSIADMLIGAGVVIFVLVGAVMLLYFFFQDRFH